MSGAWYEKNIDRLLPELNSLVRHSTLEFVAGMADKPTPSASSSSAGVAPNSDPAVPPPRKSRVENLKESFNEANASFKSLASARGRPKEDRTDRGEGTGFVSVGKKYVDNLEELCTYGRIFAKLPRIVDFM